MKVKTVKQMVQDVHWFEQEAQGAMCAFVHAPELPDSVYLKIERNDDGLWVGSVKENHMHDHCQMVHEGTELFSIMQSVFETAAQVAEQGQRAIQNHKDFVKSVTDTMHKLLVTKLADQDMSHLSKWLSVGLNYKGMNAAPRARFYTSYKAYPYAKDLSATLRQSENGTYDVWVDAVVYDADKPNLGWKEQGKTSLEDAVECVLRKLDEFSNSERHIPYTPPSVKEDVLTAHTELMEAFS